MKTLPGFSIKLLLTGTLLFIYLCSWGQEANSSVSKREEGNYNIRINENSIIPLNNFFYAYTCYINRIIFRF